ncbi:MAG: hypothetical protein ABI068_13030 [Ktedonobacterales bacterium]
MRLRLSRRLVAPSLALLLVLLLVLGAAVGVLVNRALLSGGNHSTGTHVVQVAPTSTAQGQLAEAVSLNVWRTGVQSLTTTYDAPRARAQVTITLGGSVPNTPLKVSAAQELTRSLCLMALQALWTSDVALTQTAILVQGPAQDIYADVTTHVYGEATLTASAAQRIAWSTISADAAWNTYDFAFLQSDFVLND